MVMETAKIEEHFTDLSNRLLLQVDRGIHISNMIVETTFSGHAIESTIKQQMRTSRIEDPTRYVYTTLSIVRTYTQ